MCWSSILNDKHFTSNTSYFILYCAGLHVSVFIDHHQARLWIVFYICWLHIGIPLCLQLHQCVYLYINALKSGDGIVNGTRIICGCWVCSWGRMIKERPHNITYMGDYRYHENSEWKVLRKWKQLTCTTTSTTTKPPASNLQTAEQRSSTETTTRMIRNTNPEPSTGLT